MIYDTLCAEHQRDVLLIDIDDTITHQIPDPSREIRGQSLLYLMREVAVASNGMDYAQADRIIDHILNEVHWWHWTDFILGLKLDGAAFWDYAHQQESAYLGPVYDEVVQVIPRLHRAGFKMFITSNNPSSGMLHKLRLAGLADIWGSPYFLQYLSPCDLHYMKSDAEYWRRALAHIGVEASRVITIGDMMIDDVQRPREAGITASILIDHQWTGQPRDESDGLRRVGSWHQIEQLLVSSLVAKGNYHPSGMKSPAMEVKKAISHQLSTVSKRR